ncbi:hypothetical protein E4K72_12945 [Oxalobacteraceae bacterium OM1]|nr:hypothetical protein E4K72_12945 [Oxalobacteraceae bacterium OM1]
MVVLLAAPSLSQLGELPNACFNHVARARSVVELASLRSPSPAIACVLTRLLAGTVRSAALEDSPLPGTTEFEDAFVNAFWGVMQATH